MKRHEMALCIALTAVPMSCANPKVDRLEVTVKIPGWDADTFRLRLPEHDFRVTRSSLDVRPLNDIALEVTALDFGLASAGSLRIQGEISVADEDGYEIALYENKVELVSTGTEPPPAAVAGNYPAGTRLQAWDKVLVANGLLPEGAATITLTSFADALALPYIPGSPFFHQYGDYWEVLDGTNRENNNGRETVYVWTEADPGGDGVWYAGEEGSWTFSTSRRIRTLGGF